MKPLAPSLTHQLLGSNFPIPLRPVPRSVILLDEILSEVMFSIQLRDR
jgi:hypothetical protein